MRVRSRILLISALIVLALVVLVIVQSLSLGTFGGLGASKLRIIFCDVGQGDAILVITPGGKQILVDGGPGSKAVDCLSQNMPFWDREIEFLVNTHPQQDHLEGLVAVLARYKVDMIATTQVKHETQLFGAWQQAVKTEAARIYIPRAGDELILDSNRGSTPKIKILWPSAASLSKWQAEPPKDLNETSIVMRIDYGLVCAYLTGDIPKEILEGIVDKPCQILKVAHHGSKTGTSDQVLDKIKPQIAVIQAGKKNRFGHPHKEVVDLLESHHIQILRNDLNGTVEVYSDGKSFSIKN